MQVMNFRKMKTDDPYSCDTVFVQAATKEGLQAETKKRNELAKKLTGKVQRIFFNGDGCTKAKQRTVDKPKGSYAVGANITR